MIGGGEVSLVQLVQHLDASKYQPVVLSPEEGAFSEKIKSAGIRSAILPMPSLKGAGLFRLPRRVQELAELSRKYDIGILHANGSRSMIYGGLAARWAGIPIVWHVRIMDREPILDFCLGTLATRIVANSAAVAQRFRLKALSRKVTVVHNGLDLNQFNPAVEGHEVRAEFSLDESTRVVTMVGRMDEWKGHRFFLEAARKVLDEFNFLHNRAATGRERTSVKFLLVGDGPQRSHLEQLSRHLNLTEEVIFCGYREDIPEILAASDLLLSASFGESFGRVLIEAMALAKPVVATRSGGVPEIVVDGETGILVNPGDSTEMAGAMIALLRNTELREKMGRAGLVRVKSDFGIEKHARRIEEIYDSL